VSEIIIPAEAVQYLEAVRALLGFVGAICVALVFVGLSILLGEE
jgi:hypothetical protein